MTGVQIFKEPRPPATAEQRIGEYVKVRDTIKKLKDDFEKSIEPLVDLQNSLTGWLQHFMDQNGVDSVKTNGGTAYTSTKYTASLADPDAFMQFVIENKQFDLIDRKANVTAVRDYTATNGNLPPGVNLSSIQTVNVRRPAGKS